MREKALFSLHGHLLQGRHYVLFSTEVPALRMVPETLWVLNKDTLNSGWTGAWGIPYLTGPATAACPPEPQGVVGTVARGTYPHPRAFAFQCLQKHPLLCLQWATSRSGVLQGPSTCELVRGKVSAPSIPESHTQEPEDGAQHPRA